MPLKNKGVIKFNYHQTEFKLKEVLYIKTYMASVMAKENTPFSRIEYVFCTDEYLLELNRRYLQHDTFTDILTFTLSLPEDPIISEIYISIDRVKENAEKLNVSFDEELHRVMIHGLLHLCGYEDHSAAEAKLMRQKENEYLQLM